MVRAKLPPLPGSVMQISMLLLDYNVSQKKIADAVSCDPMLASRVLRLANSPIYAFQQKISSLTEAVVALGNKTMYELVMIGAVADGFAKEIRNSVVGRDNWLHSLATALTARELCALRRMRGIDEAFSCGLLHDIGKLLMFRADPELFLAVSALGDGNDSTDLEKEHWGFDHAQAGALAARRWHLPEPVCNMILYHHDPTAAAHGLLMTHVINVADNLSYLKNKKLPYPADFLESASMITLGFTVEQLDAVWEKVAADLRSVVKAFYR